MKLLLDFLTFIYRDNDSVVLYFYNITDTLIKFYQIYSFKFICILKHKIDFFIFL